MLKKRNRRPCKEETKEKIRATLKRKRLVKLHRIFEERKLVKGTILKPLLIEFTYMADVCAKCGQLPEWNGKPLTLELDHIDGDRMNNSLDNLRILIGRAHV